MSRSVRTLLLGAAALVVGGCFQHHTVDEDALLPLEGMADEDLDDDDDGSTGGNGDGDTGSNGDGDDAYDDEEEPDEPAPSVCDNPTSIDVILQCALSGGGGLGDLLDIIGGGGTPTEPTTPTIPGLDCTSAEAKSNPLLQLVCGLTGGTGTGTGGGLGSIGDTLECLLATDVATQIRCALQGLGGSTGGLGNLGDILGGLTGGGTTQPTTPAAPTTPTLPTLTAAQCKNPTSPVIQLLCGLNGGQ